MLCLNDYFSDTSGLFLLLMFPASYVAHIADEYWSGDGYPAHLFNHYGIELTPSRFLQLQGFGLGLMSLGVWLALTCGFPHTLLLILAVVAIANVLAHTLRSVINRHCEPGLATALLLWLPLGPAAVVYTWNSLSTVKFLCAILCGTLISGIVEVIASRGGRLLRSRLLR